MERDWVVLNIDENRMWATLALKKPEGEEQPQFTSQFVENYLRENGIIYGIDNAAVKSLCEVVEYNREVVVAKGKSPVNGKDGFYQYMVKLEDARSKPKINPDGSVDYYNSLNLAMVKKGDLIANYIEPTLGEAGYSIFKEEIAPVKGKQLRPLKVKGVEVIGNGKEYRAAFDGRIYKEEDKIIVDKIYVVNGDLDISYGNINFNGDVEIKGDVRSGLKIEAGGNIYIHGHVGSCQLIAAGNITIKEGVQGKDKCEIIAKKDIAASFVERCSMVAEGSIYADSLLDCNVASKQMVVTMSKRGVIVGGKVFATQGITAKQLGNDTNISTSLQAGVVPSDIRHLNELSQKLNKIKKDIEFLDKNLKICESIEGRKRNKETEATRMKIIRAKVILSADEKKLVDEIEYLNSEIDRAKKEARVTVSNVVYPGTKVCMGRSTYAVKEACKDVHFKVVNHEVVMRSNEEV